MLRVALPNKGSLSQSASVMLTEAGYKQRRAERDLTCVDTDNGIEFFYLRPRDIATYVGSGDLDLGITGRDLLIDSGAPAEEVVALGFGGSVFRYAARPGTVDSVDELGGRRIATSYPGLVARHLAERGLSAEVIRLDGAVENAVGLGVADVVADVVSTGATLRQAGLEPFGEALLESEATLIRRVDGPVSDAADGLVRRVRGVLVAREYVMLAYDVRVELVEQASALTPGIESPTVSPLHREGWVAVQAMTPARQVQRIMDELYAIGARGILVTRIHACRI